MSICSVSAAGCRIKRSTLVSGELPSANTRRDSDLRLSLMLCHPAFQITAEQGARSLLLMACAGRGMHVFLVFLSDDESNPDVLLVAVAL